MNPLLIIANFKSNKTLNEAKNWLEVFKNEIKRINYLEKKIIICPPITLVNFFKEQLINSPEIFLGAQDISRFEKGAYTGEINGEQLKEFVDFVIIGHSERRRSFNEDEEILNKKVEMAIRNNLTPIYCVDNKLAVIPEKVKIVAYEPVFAIGSGKPDTPENADQVSRELKKKTNDLQVIYGGSVSSENVNSFTKKDNINGVLVGGASLDPQEFIKIINNA